MSQFEMTKGAMEAKKILEKENSGLINAPESVVRIKLEAFQGRTLKQVEDTMRAFVGTSISQETQKQVEELLKKDVLEFQQRAAA